MTPDEISWSEHFIEILNERDKRYEQRFNDSATAVNAALTAAEKAVTKAEVAADKRFDAVNEFRAQLNDQASHFMTRIEGGALIDRNTKDIQELKDRMNTTQGRGAGLTAGWGYLITGVGLVATLIAIFIALS